MCQADIPDIVRRHFQLTAGDDTGVHHHPWVSKVFHPGRGWSRPRTHELTSRAVAAELRGRGVTQVELTCGPRGHNFWCLPPRERLQLPAAEFTTSELVQRPRQPDDEQ